MTCREKGRFWIYRGRIRTSRDSWFSFSPVRSYDNRVIGISVGGPKNFYAFAWRRA